MTPYALATDSIRALSRSGASCQALSSRQRTVPSAIPSSGMALAAVPALTRPHTRLRLDRGSTRRDSAAGSSVTILPSAYTRSAVRCGRAVCAPGPVTRTVILSQAAVIGPLLVPTFPTSSRGSQCSAKIRSAEAMPTAARTSREPPGTRLPGQEHPRTQGDGRVHVMPAGVAYVRHGRPVGHLLLVGHRKRVEVGAQGHQRAAVRLAADVHQHAGPLGQDDRAQADRGQPERYPPRGPVLVITELRVRVQVPAELDELGLVRGKELVELPQDVTVRHAEPPQGRRNDPPRTRSPARRPRLSGRPRPPPPHADAGRRRRGPVPSTSSPARPRSRAGPRPAGVPPPAYATRHGAAPWILRYQ